MGRMGEGRLSGGESPANHRLTVPEASAELGITEAAVRGRIKRGTLDSYRESGTVYVLLEGGAPATNRDAPADKPTDQPELVETLREQVAYLRGVITARDRELALRAEEIRRRDNALEREQELTAMFADRLRQLEGPPETPQAPETASEGTDRPETPADVAGSQEATERRSWWRRWLGVG